MVVAAGIEAQVEFVAVAVQAPVQLPVFAVCRSAVVVVEGAFAFFVAFGGVEAQGAFAVFCGAVGVHERAFGDDAARAHVEL